MRKVILLAIGVFLAFWGEIYAQWTVDKPARSEEQTFRVADRLRSASSSLGVYVLPSLEQSSSELRSLQEAREREFRTLTYALPRVLTPEVMNYGQWLEGERGDFVWRLSITSPDALGLALRLEQYRLPRGAALYAYGSAGGRIGALTELHNSPVGILMLAPLSGETITLEYEPPRGYTPGVGEAPPFVVASLDHDFVGLRQQLPRRKGKAKEGEPLFDAIMSLESMSCAPNVVARPECRLAARSVVILAVGGSMGSGALINTPRSDGKAYILTAAHNINSLYEVTDMETIKAMVRSAVIFFGFESPSLEGNIRATEEQSLSGAELVAYDPEADMALLEITGLQPSPQGIPSIPAEYNAYFSGWTLSPTPAAPYYGVHHPGILTKRYSQAEDTNLNIVDFSAASRGLHWHQKHWHLKRWAVGSTARGSSGSPLFDREGRIIGALTAGFSYCPITHSGRQPEDDYYYAVHRAWRGATPLASLASVLDPDGTGVTECPGYDPHKAEALYRLSDLYAADRGADLATISPDAEGVGRLIVIDGSARSLGAYLIFRGNEAIDRAFPQLLLELTPYDRQTKQLGQPIWRQEVSSARYQFYRPFKDEHGDLHFDKWKHETDTRTLSQDTIELFIPVAELASSLLSHGEYLLTLRSKQGGGLGLPLLQRRDLRRTSPDANMWYYSGGGWKPGPKEQPAQLWLDLLVRSTSRQRGKALPLNEVTEVETYYHGNELIVSLPSGAERGQVRIYSEDGKLMRRHDLSEGENKLSLYLPATAMYVAKIESSKGGRVLKFLVR
ncbi:MAG: trypsin-like peptidase domain-containing protein [Porphyromonadaceae bacterium]|nr:trypsin-like peptidase domain-containing protein [Porphyromonadaceae bacterium]